MSWYPLGRPVGTTIYPGLQFTAVWIKKYFFPGDNSENDPMPLYDVCCYIPAWFGVIATIVTGLIAYECTLPQNAHSSLIGFVLDVWHGRKTTKVILDAPASFLSLPHPAVECGLAAAGMMAIVPAHLMRSVGGGFDNESIAVSAMVLTFYCWIRSLRNLNVEQAGDATANNDNRVDEDGLKIAADSESEDVVSISYVVLWSVVAALAYFYMVAAWGGYVFVLNLVGVHAAMLVVAGRFNTQVYLAYTIFYGLGTLLAIQIPVVGLTPLRSLEQLGPCMVFLGYQLIQFCEFLIRMKNKAIKGESGSSRQGLSKMSRRDEWKLRFRVFSIAGVVLILAIALLAPKGYFGPISARVRGLFVKHTKTGNPLVDSVAEHAPASGRAYFQYLHHVCTLAPIGFVIVFMNLSDASSFLIVWGTTAYFFSHKMVRLILLTGPIGSVLGGIAAGRLLTWCIRQWWEHQEPQDMPAVINSDTIRSKAGKKKKKDTQAGSSFDGLLLFQEVVNSALKTKEGIFLKRSLAVIVLFMGYTLSVVFINYSYRLSLSLSNPSIILMGRNSDNELVKVDDYRQAYWWLRDNTPEDARVMAWWDYGYQIAGIANRTTIADGNTWNHEHIALLGKALTSELNEGWEIARHWADYVLVWAGGRGDDMAKSPHLARIANSVYRDHCPDDPTCRAFGFLDREGTPSAMMARSLLYRLHSHRLRPGVEAPEDKFQEVFKSQYGYVRIFKIVGVSEESKAWVADPANRLCDVPGSWYCPGQYPPGLSEILARKKDFQQLEDFNRGKADEEYQKRYFEDLNDPNAAKKKIMEKELEAAKAAQQEAGAAEEPKSVDEVYNTWEDTEDTTRMWKLISSNSVDELKAWLEEKPHKAFIRSRDGRGPMWWAFEQRNEQITNLLMKAGVPHTDRDAKGMTPVDLLGGEQP